MPPLTDDQFDKLVDLQKALAAAEAALPGETPLALAHEAMTRALSANRSRMTDAQFHTLNGGPKD